MAKKAKTGTADELLSLLPGQVLIPVKVRRNAEATAFDDATVIVTEMDVIQVAGVIRALAPIRDALSVTAPLLEVAAEHPDEICAALAVAVCWEAEQVRRMGAASFLKVLTAVYEANGDFFGQLLAHLASGILAAPSQTNGAGERPSPTSAGTATSATPAA